MAPVLGSLTDMIVQRAKKGAVDQNSIDFKVQEVKANFVPLLITSLCSVGMYFSLMFFNDIIIYFSLVCLIVCRSCIFSASTAFLRARFPVDHLNRLLGIYSTVVSLMLLLVYPHFVWAMEQYYFATAVALFLTVLELSYPIHLLFVKRLHRALLATFPERSDDDKMFMNNTTPAQKFPNEG